MTSSVNKLVIHIEDEFSHWVNLVESIEADILNFLLLIDHDHYNNFELTPPVDENQSPVITKMAWKQGDQEYTLTWALIYDANLAELKNLGVFEEIENENTFFIVDASKEDEKGNLEVTLNDSLKNIQPFVLSTKRQLRVFTAYRRELIDGMWVVPFSVIEDGKVKKKSTISDYPDLVISKTGLNGSRKSLPTDLSATIIAFILGGENV